MNLFALITRELSDPDIPSRAAFSSLNLRYVCVAQELQPVVQNLSSITYWLAKVISVDFCLKQLSSRISELCKL